MDVSCLRNKNWCPAMAIHRDRMLHSRTTVEFMIRSPLAYDFALLLFRPHHGRLVAGLGATGSNHHRRSADRKPLVSHGFLSSFLRPITRLLKSSAFRDHEEGSRELANRIRGPHFSEMQVLHALSSCYGPKFALPRRPLSGGGVMHRSQVEAHRLQHSKGGFGRGGDDRDRCAADHSAASGKA